MPAKAFEILFIDNRSKDKGGELIRKELEGTGLNYQILSFNDFPSSYAARNVGVKASEGDLLVFTDADCIPSEGWLEAIVKTFSDHPEKEFVLSGRVELVVEDPKNPWELFDHHFHMDNEQAEKSGRVATANMAVRRELFERIGPFREVRSGGDHEWSRRARAAGAEIITVPEALVYHPTRKTGEEVLKKLCRTSAGLGELSRGSLSGFVKGSLKTLLRPFLFHRHWRFATSRAFEASPVFRIRLFLFSFLLRCRQIAPFFTGFFSSRR